MRRTALRGLALFLGAFAAANAVGGIVAPGFDANVWWIDVRALPPGVATASLGATGVLLAAWAIRPSPGPARRFATRTALWTVAGLAAWDAARVVALAADGSIHAFPVPFSALVVAALVAVGREVRHSPPAVGCNWPVAPAAAGWAAAFALLQMLCFGGTDYARSADAIVVFGARTYADGRPSQALADRVRTACSLWRDGRAPLLVLSGGPGDGAVHETEAMAALARAEGVPDEAIVRDRDGTNTRATVANVAALLRSRGLHTTLAVSHSYHLPRVKMAFDRAGVGAYTVPARESRPIPRMPWFVGREVVALWGYWISPSSGV